MLKSKHPKPQERVRYEDSFERLQSTRKPKPKRKGHTFKYRKRVS